MKRICPACLTRRARLVAENCPVCRGAGVIALGGDAVSEHGAETVSRAVSIALEAVAREVDKPGEDRAAAVARIRGAGRALAAAGLTGWSRGRRPKTSAPTGATPATLAHHALGVTVQPQDWILPEAPSYRYGASERPGARGLPVLSDDGHPSHLARVCDPADPIDTTTTQDVYRRASEHRRAVILAMRAAES